MKYQQPWKYTCPPHLYVSIVHMCIYVYMFACVCMLEVRGLCQFSSSVALHLMFSKSHWTWGLPIQLDWLPKNPPVSSSPVLGLQIHDIRLFFFYFFFKSGFWGSKFKLNSHVFVVSILSTVLVCLLIQDSATRMNSNKIMNSHQTTVDKRFFTMCFVKSSD